MKNSKIFLSILIPVLFIPFLALAHQPRIPEGAIVSVSEPEISKAYYSELTGDSHVYEINADEAFDFYVNLLVPDISAQKRDVSAIIIRSGDIENNPLAILNGPNFEWYQFFEPFGHDTYWKGPEYRANVPAGKYQIIVTSTLNDSKYALAVGEIENFNMQEGWNAMRLIPKIKKDFFEKLPVDFIFSPFGWGLILSMLVLGSLFVLLIKLIIKKIFKKGVGDKKNIGKKDRIIRAILAFILVLLGIFTSWCPIYFFLAGVILFTAIFPWCGLYAILGKKTC